MKYGSVCSGIEAASVAWHNLGWEPQWFSEIEQFPSEVLKHRFPDVPNLGDMTQLTQNPTFNERSINLLVGGTPCQSFSVAGLRKGLADPRGNLMLTFLALADAKKPKWIVWENVPGVLSSNGGRDFGTFLGALGELGYGFAYRVLDAQYFGVAQRRRRVFVVGYLGDWRVAAAVLFERESLQGNTKPSRKKREEIASDAQRSVGEAGDVSCVGGNISPTVTSKWKTGYGGPSGSNEAGNMVYAPTVIDRAAFNQGENAQYEPRIETGETMSSLVARGPHAVAQPIAFEPGKMQRLGYGYSDNGTSPTLRSEPGDNQLAVAQPIAIQDVRPIEKAQNGRGWNDDGTSYTVDTKATQGVAQPLYYESHPQDSRVNGPKDVADTVSANYGMGGGNTPLVQQPFRKVRRAQSDSDFETWEKDETANTINCFDVGDVRSTNVVAQPIAFKVRGGCEGGGKGYLGQEEQAFTISTMQDQQIAQPIAIDFRNNRYNEKQIAGTLQSKESGGYSLNYTTGVHQPPMAIRRLTPKECERLQGFPDDWTKIPYRNKEADQCPDGPRYKACGNSMAVPVMRWIGQRIQYVENLMKEL
jgi:DNA (cytosine-5)-methyltransferase 1